MVWRYWVKYIMCTIIQNYPPKSTNLQIRRPLGVNRRVGCIVSLWPLLLSSPWGRRGCQFWPPPPSLSSPLARVCGDHLETYPGASLECHSLFWTLPNLKHWTRAGNGFDGSTLTGQLDMGNDFPRWKMIFHGSDLNNPLCFRSGIPK